MLRGPVRLLVATACALVLASCGTTTYVDTEIDGQRTITGPGWQPIDPIPLDLPTDDPIPLDLPTDPSGTLQRGPGPGPAVPVIVNIWASFCEPCKDELPLLQEADEGGEVVVRGYTRDRTDTDARAALAAAGVTYPNWLDPDATVALSLDGRVPLNGIPSSILVRDGKAIAVHIGPFPDLDTILAAREIR